LSDEELKWLPVRRNATIQPMREFLGRLTLGIDTDTYLTTYSSNASALPNIGIAISGGGYRALLNGAGVVQAFDNRTPNATNAGQLGGLLQSSTYLAGLSGGSWLVGSLYTNNFSSISDILGYSGSGSSLWQFQNSIFEGPSTGSIQVLDSVSYYSDIRDSVTNKEDAGFDTTLTDYWGRALSYQLVNASNGGPEYTFSSIATQDWFTTAEAPLPIIVADGRAPGEILIPTNTTVYEFNPWEMGSHDPTVYGFAPLQYLGTNFSAGSPLDDTKCVTGFDSAGFIMGTSSSLFNQGLLLLNSTDAGSSGPFKDALQSTLLSVLSKLGKDENDIADYPNPFYKYNKDTNPNAASEQLTLVDGGEDNQNIPLNPLIQPARMVDVIFAVDSSADTNETWPTADSAPGWPNGASLQATYRRSLEDIQNTTGFPSIPSVTTFQNLGLNAGPTFFGCDAANFSTGTNIPPLIVYLPNAPYVYNSNISTFDPSYNLTERDAIVANGYEGATQGNGTLDAEWANCVGCAVLSRSFYRTGTAAPDACTKCFTKYCWDGTINDAAPAKYDPALKLEDDKINVAKGGAAERLGGVLFAVVVAVVMGAVNLA
jgi:lysophospholipase